ncbi:MAG: hypothetical protein D6696_04825 [Acidobacteria bacterium]|nr:MAG: hypothetical protein D6696_04825 [Acidobacteriota bacterium]
MSQRISSPGTLLLGISVAALALMTGGCGEKIAHLGVIVPESGQFKTYGQAIRKGIELAADEIRADPGYPLKLQVDYADSQSDPKKAAELLDQMYDNGVIVAIGGAVTGEALEMVQVADQHDRVLVSPTASSPELTQISSNFFRIYPSDFLEANKMALFARETLGLDKIVIMAEEQDYATGIQQIFKQEFERLGGEVLEVVEYPPFTTDFSGLAEFVKGFDPPGVYLAGYDTSVAEMIRALRAVGCKGKILTTAAFATPSAIARAGEAAVGVLLTKVVFEVDSEHAHIKSFVEAFEKRFGEKPDWLAAHGYDAMKVVAEAIRDRPLITSEIIKGLRAIKDFPGVTGSIQFDEKGDVKKFPRVYLVSKDLTLYNYDSHAEEQRRLLLQKRRELEERLKRLQREAEEIGG